jgi:hypothetical protein
VGAPVLISGTWYKLIDAKVQHRYNAELERLKDHLSRSSKEIDTLRASVLSLRAQRQASVEKRRLEAIDQLWAAVTALQSRKGKALMMSFIKFESAAELAKGDPKVRQLFEMIGGGKLEDEVLPPHQAHEAQPYVSPLAWALFNAYQSAIGYLSLQLSILKIGVGPDAIKDPRDMVALLSEALPEWKDQLEEHGTTIFPYVIDELEKRLLAELRRIIAGEQDDADQIERASRISGKIEEVRRRASEAEIKAVLEVGGEKAA